MWFKKEIDINDLDDFFWSGARDRWNDATDNQKEEVWNRIQECADCRENDLLSDTEINDLVWFECDDIFYREDDDEEYDENEEDDEDVPF